MIIFIISNSLSAVFYDNIIYLKINSTDNKKNYINKILNLVNYLKPNKT